MPAFKLVQRASTLVPTEPMTAIAATTIRPAIKAYSRTSPPASSRTSLANVLQSVFIVVFSFTASIGEAHDALDEHITFFSCIGTREKHGIPYRTQPPCMGPPPFSPSS